MPYRFTPSIFLGALLLIPTLSQAAQNDNKTQNTSSAAPVHLIEPFLGTFEASQNKDAYKEKVSRAVDTATQRMNFFVKGRARRTLKELTKPCQSFTFTLPDDAISIQCDARRPNIAPADGTPRHITETDENHALTYTVLPRQIVQTFHSENGIREDIYLLNSDKTTLQVQTTIQSPWLIEPVVYSLEFQRKSSSDESQHYSSND